MASVLEVSKATFGIHFLITSSVLKSFICLRFLEINRYNTITKMYVWQNSVFCIFLFSNYFFLLRSNDRTADTLLLFQRQKNKLASCSGLPCLLPRPWLTRQRRQKLVTNHRQKVGTDSQMKGGKDKVWNFIWNMWRKFYANYTLCSWIICL